MALNSTKTPSSATMAVSLGVMVGLVVATVVLASSKKKSSRRRLSKQGLQLASLLSYNNAFWIQHVRIPISNLPESLQETAKADAEGLVACHVYIKSNKLAQIVFSAGPDDPVPRGNKSWWWLNICPVVVIQAHGCILLPAFCDAHTHLVKTQSVVRNRNTTGTMGEAYAVEHTDMVLNWGNTASVLRHMDFGVQCARHYGTQAMRTHLDGTASDDPAVVAAVYQAYDALVEKYHANDMMYLQGVANLFLPQWLDEPLATEFANRAAQHPNIVLGAYIGNPPPTEKLQTRQALQALLAHAQRLSLNVDLHIDESNDPACCVVLELIKALKQARQDGYQGHVLLGHCCAFSLQDVDTQVYICTELAKLGNVHVVANPYTNTVLQDRRGSCPPFGLAIPADVPCTPKWRGLTTVQELQAAGVTVAVASDNVRDHWYPYGDFDLLAVWAHCLLVGHLDTVPSAGAWAHLCNDSAARAMGLLSNNNTCLFQAGQPASGILFPQARNISELLARPQTDRIVLRNGQVQTTQLPEFADLDDLVAVPTPRPAPEAYLENPQEHADDEHETK